MNREDGAERPDVQLDGDEQARGRDDEPARPRGPIGAGRQVFQQSMRDDVMGLAAELSYRFFLALFPFFIFLTALGGFLAAQLPIDNPAEEAVQLLGDALPEEAAEMVQGQLQNIINNQNPGLLSLGALLALFFATGGTNAIIKAMDRVYGVRETRPIWKRYLIAIVMTLVAGAALVGAFLLLVPLRIFGPEIAEFLNLGEEAGTIVTVGGALIAFMLVVLAAAYVYRVAPNIELPLKSVLIGAFLFAIAWVVGTIGFFLWVTEFGDYTDTYGALAGVVIVLIWFYVSALIFLVAGEVNEVVHEMRAPGDVEKRRRAAEEGESADEADDERRESESRKEREGRVAVTRRESRRDDRRYEDDADEEGAAPA